jgi:hypothetical protein
MARVYQRRRVALKVRDGVVQKKNNHKPTAALGYVLARESPSRGCRHVVSKQDVRLFTSIIPNWQALADGLESVILTASGERHDGRYQIYRREKTGSIQIPAWEGDLWQVVDPVYFREHADVYELLGVVTGPDPEGIQCRFTRPQAKAFLLLHVFLHELGHHFDRMTTKSQSMTPRGEEFAERYARDLCAAIWPDYVRVFGNPRA